MESLVAAVVIHAAGSSISSWLFHPQHRLLRHVLRLADAAQHPVRHPEAAPPDRLQLFIGDRNGHRTHCDHQTKQRAAL